MLTEDELIRRCVQKDAIAERLLFDKYSGLLMAICNRYSRDRHMAEDMLQEAFIAIFYHLKQFRFEGSFEGWLKRITITAAIRLLRKKKINFSEITTEHVAFIDPQENIFSDLNAENLLKLISELPDGYRTIFNLYAIEGYSHDDIAGILHIKTATSRSQLSKARAMLREKILYQNKLPANENR